MIQLRFVGSQNGAPCFLAYDEDYRFRIEIAARGEILYSRVEGEIHQVMFVLGTHETAIIEQFGVVVLVLHGEAVEA